MEKEKFNIYGMTCSSCALHVENAVKKLKGVKTVNVNLLSNSMIVEYDSNILNNSEIIESVKKAGYDASIFKSKKGSINEDKKINKVNSDIQNMKKRLIVSIIFLIPLMYISMHHMLYEYIGLPIPKIISIIFDGYENSVIFAFAQFLLLLPIIFININYYIIGFKRLFKIKPNMDSLIAIGSSAATLYGILAIFILGYGLGHGNTYLVERYSMDIYFESAGTILTLITLGKYLELKSKARTTSAIEKLINLVPKNVTIIRDDKEFNISIEEVMLGDILLVKPGESIGVDGNIIEGNSLVDESSISGESIPVAKKIGDNVISGTINKNGYLKIKATKVGENTTISQIIKLVEEASNSKAPISKIADKVSRIFVPTVILISLTTFIIWILIGQTFEFALTMSIAVLVISCPCALGLATPVAIMVGTGKGAENGILIKSAESLELLHKVDTIILDKTGTITEGKPKVTDIISNIEEKELLKIAGSLEKNSEHPLSEAVMNRLKDDNIEILDVEKFENVSGRGVKGKINKKQYFAGNIAFMKENNIDTTKVTVSCTNLQNDGKTLLYFANNKEIIGVIAVSDVIKPTSYKAIEELKKRNIKIEMVTGDNNTVAKSIGNKVGITNIVSEVLPQYKAREVEKLQKVGKKVAFVGDGINDSPALVKADVGIAIGSGADIAIESADIVLVKNSLLDVVGAIDLSKAVIKNIKMNLFWAFLYNIIGIPIACGIFYPIFGLRLNPMICAFAMSLSSVCVVTNALRLKKFKLNFREEKGKMKEIIKNISIEGMSCNHCKMTVEKALYAIDGVTDVSVNLEKKQATIKLSKEVSDDKIKAIISEAGFIVSKITL